MWHHEQVPFRRVTAIGVSAVVLGVVAAGTVTGLNVTASPSPVSTPTISADALADAHETDTTTTRSADRESIENAATARSATLTDQNQAITDAETELLVQNRAEDQAALSKDLDTAAKRQTFLEDNGYDPDTTDPADMARQMMKNQFGWGDAEFTCYNNIIMRESKWDVYADNPTSSAYGIPQALPGSRMASEGADWKTNPATQIRWGLKYVRDRYGSPCSAWSFKAAHGWY